jgi:exonuclease SbcC
MRAILDTRRGMRDQRKETIRRALRIQEFKVAADNLRLVGSEAEALAREERASAAGLDEAEDKAREAQADVEVETIGREETSKALEGARAREASTRAAWEALEAVRRDLAEGERELELFRARLAEARGDTEVAAARLDAARGELERRDVVRSRLEELKDVPARLEEITAKVRRLDELKEEHQRRLRQLAGLEERLSRAEGATSRVEELGKEMEALHREGPPREGTEVQLAEARERLGQLEQDRARAQLKVDELEGEVDELTSLEGRRECPRCHQPLSGEHLRELLERNRVDMRRHTGNLREIASATNRLEERIEALAGDLRRLDELERRRAVVGGLLEEARSTAQEGEGLRTAVSDLGLERLKEELDAAEGEVDEEHHRMLIDLDAERRDLARQLEATACIEAKVAQLEDALSKTSEAREAAEAAVGEAETGLAGLREGFDEEALADAREAHMAATRALGGLQSELVEREERLRRAELLLTERTSRVDELRYHVARMEHYVEVHRWLVQCIRPALEQIELEVLSIMHDEMDASARTWFERLVEDPDLELEVDEEFVPTVTQQGFAISVDALSGGERTAVAFAYRLALNGLVQRISDRDQANLLLLDEPSDGFSREQLVRMGGVLRDVPADQIVIVSHDRELRSFSDHVFVVRKSGGESQLSSAG